MKTVAAVLFKTRLNTSQMHGSCWVSSCNVEETGNEKQHEEKCSKYYTAVRLCLTGPALAMVGRVPWGQAGVKRWNFLGLSRAVRVGTPGSLGLRVNSRSAPLPAPGQAELKCLFLVSLILQGPAPFPLPPQYCPHACPPVLWLLLKTDQAPPSAHFLSNPALLGLAQVSPCLSSCLLSQEQHPTSLSIMGLLCDHW